ncbi:uncharacterized protein LOC127850250 isoform X1 [Dreissena polymorpha]|uniref:uncharacterized protein LOC127850250 isoform X1 n=1 Tax=Dreissena polymorpha TaxID=45954 RepID=UPI002264EFA8|nr:uncharacterized protein LOC127850250 isoform X1 [Dreissena polymorpha]
MRIFYTKQVHTTIEMPRLSRERTSGDFSAEQTTDKGADQRSPGPIKDSPLAPAEEGQDDAILSKNTCYFGNSNAFDTTTAIFAQIIQSHWEIEDEDEEDEADAIGSDLEDDVDEKGVCHTHNEIVSRLQRIGDDFFERQKQAPHADTNVVDRSQYIRDVATKIMSSNTFEDFIGALPSESAKTIGWEQVALYSVIIHSSIMMVGVGTEIKNSITSYASQYFQSRFSDWINSQPRQWYSIFDEPRSVPIAQADCD